MPTLILVESWQWTPFVFIIVYARLQALPQEVFEAAIVDGAKPLATFRFVTLPLLMPAIIFAAVFRAVDSFRSFDLIFGLSYGGPARSTTTLSFFSFQNGFQWQNYGYAAAVSYMMLLILAVGTIVLLRFVQIRPGVREMKRKIGRAFAYLVLIMLGLAGIAPIVYLGVLSTKKRIEILAQVPPTLDFKWARITKNYNEVLFSQGMLEFTVNSIIVVGATTVLVLVIATPCGLRLLALPLSRQREPRVHDPEHALHAAGCDRDSAVPHDAVGGHARQLPGADPALYRVLPAAGGLDHDRVLRRDPAGRSTTPRSWTAAPASRCCGA